MNKEVKEYLDAMEDLMGSRGWKYLVEDAQRQIYQLQADALDERVCKTWEDVNVARGKAKTLAEIVLLPDVIANRRVQYDNASV